MSSLRLDPVRLRAGELLLRWRRGDATIEALLEAAEARDREHDRELPWDARRRLRELLLGSMHLLQRYEHAMALRGQRGRKAKDAAWVAIVLGLHEMFGMRTPDHAAVTQAVELCRRLGAPGACGFVNGVLRRVQREGLEFGFPEPTSDPIGYASLWLSHPRWIAERWAAALGSEEMLELCAWNNQRRPLCVRGLPGRREDILHEFAVRAWPAEPSRFAVDGIRVGSGIPAPLVLHEFSDSLVVQDEAAQLIAPLVAATRPSHVLDLCAAPGGKTLHLRALLPAAKLVACDASARRLSRLRASQRRLGDDSLLLLAADGRQPPLREDWADAVLLDAPCTGSGVFARRHDARWRRSPEELAALVRLQGELLEAAIAAVRPGGVVVYATCSLEPEENDGVVDALLARRRDVEELGVGELVPAAMQHGGRFAAWPQRHDCDGAFAVRLRRHAC